MDQAKAEAASFALGASGACAIAGYGDGARPKKAKKETASLRPPEPKREGGLRLGLVTEEEKAARRTQAPRGSKRGQRGARENSMRYSF